MKNTVGFVVLLAFLLAETAIAARDIEAELYSDKKHSGGSSGGGVPGDPGDGFGIPGLGGGNGWGNVGGGYGAGYGGPGGGYAHGGVVRPSVVCTEKGPCYKKKVICPAKCFSSYSRSGKNYGSGGGGGGCTIDCKKKCTAWC